MTPKQINTDSSFMGSVFQNRECEIVLANIVKLQQHLGDWIPFSWDEYVDFCSHEVSSGEKHILDIFVNGGQAHRRAYPTEAGWLAFDGEKYSFTPKLIKMLWDEYPLNLKARLNNMRRKFSQRGVKWEAKDLKNKILTWEGKPCQVDWDTLNFGGKVIVTVEGTTFEADIDELEPLITAADIIKLRDMNTGNFPIVGNMISKGYHLDYKILEKEVERLGYKKLFVPVLSINDEAVVFYMEQDGIMFEETENTVFGGFIVNDTKYFLFK